MASGGTAQPAGEVTREAFERKFGHLLAWLELDQWVVASASGRPSVYVQIKLMVDGLRMETTSNHFLMGADQLTEEQESRLLALGWRPPSDAREGSPNFYLDLPWPIDASAVAQSTARTLAEIHRVASPASVFLEAQDRGDRPVPAALAIAFDLRLAGRGRATQLTGRPAPG